MKLPEPPRHATRLRTTRFETQRSQSTQRREEEQKTEQAGTRPGSHRRTHSRTPRPHLLLPSSDSSLCLSLSSLLCDLCVLCVKVFSPLLGNPARAGSRPLSAPTWDGWCACQRHITAPGLAIYADSWSRAIWAPMESSAVKGSWVCWVCVQPRPPRPTAPRGTHRRTFRLAWWPPAARRGEATLRPRPV